MMIVTGIGFDAHRFSRSDDDVLRLAGLEWEGERALAGHWDGDVAVHAIADALLSAARLGDLGSVIGTDDPKWAGASGVKILEHIMGLISDAGFSVVNVSVQIVGNSPKVAKRRAEAEQVLSDIVTAPVSVSATTTDGMGWTGSGEGLAAIANVLLEEKVGW